MAICGYINLQRENEKRSFKNFQQKYFLFIFSAVYSNSGYINALSIPIFAKSVRISFLARLSTSTYILHYKGVPFGTPLGDRRVLNGNLRIYQSAKGKNEKTLFNFR